MNLHFRLLNLLACGVIAAGASGCAHKVEKVEVPYFPPERGKELPYTDVRRVRTPDVVQTYYAGRLPSKDRRTMREAGRVYRVVQGSAWDTRPLSQPLKGMGPVAGLQDYHYQPISPDKRVKAEIGKQREIAAVLQSQTRQMGDAAEALRLRTAQSLDERKILEMMAAKLKDEQARRQAAEQELSELKASQATQTKPVPPPATPEPDGTEALKNWNEKKSTP